MSGSPHSYSEKSSHILDFLIKAKWPLFVMWVILFRLPHILLADNRLDGDGAHFWIVMEYILAGKGFYLLSFGVNHVGMTESFLSLPFIPIVGHSQTAYQLALASIFLFYSIIIYRLTKQFYGQRPAHFSLLLMAIPHPFVNFYSLRAYGGHILSIALALLALHLWALWLARAPAAVENRTTIPGSAGMLRTLRLEFSALAVLRSLGLGCLLGFAVYTSRLSSMSVAALLLAWLVHALWQRRLSLLVYLVLGLIGAGIGMIPWFVGMALQPVEIHYAQKFALSFADVGNKLWVIVKGILPGMLDVVHAPGIEESGFRPDKGARTVLFAWQIIMMAPALLGAGVLVASLIDYLRGKATPTYGILFAAIFCANLGAVLLSSQPITVQHPLVAMLEGDDVLLPISLRYFLPTFMALPPLFALLASGDLRLPPKWVEMLPWARRIPTYAARLYLIGHVIVYSLGYVRGYQPNSTLYHLTGDGGGKQVYSYLKQKNISHCVAHFWVANNLVYYSRLNLTATPLHGWPEAGLVKHPEFEREVLTRRQGIECVIEPKVLAASLRSDDPNARFVRPYEWQGHKLTTDLRIIEHKIIGQWLVLLVREEPGSIARRRSIVQEKE